MNKKRSIKILVKLSMIGMLLTTGRDIVHAEDETSTSTSETSTNQVKKETDREDPVGFVVSTILPDTQVEREKSFFYILVKPNETQKLAVRIKSTRKEPVTVAVSIENAMTNSNGQIDYPENQKIMDETLKDPITSFVKPVEEKVTIQNFEEKILTIDVDPPEKTFEGVRVGAILFMLANDEEKPTAGLSNNYGYRIGIVATEQIAAYDDGETLELNKVGPSLQNGRKVIAANLQNPEPKVLKDLEVETKLYKKGDSKILKSTKKVDMRMAPNSHFDFLTEWGLEPMRPGTYILQIHAKSGEKEWNWKKEFTISGKEAKKINDESVYRLVVPSWIPYATIGLAIWIVIWMVALFIRSKKWRERSERRIERRKKRTSKERKK